MYKFDRTETRRRLSAPQLTRYDTLSPTHAREIRVLEREVMVGSIGAVFGIILWLLPVVASRLDLEVSRWLLTAGHYAPALATFATVFAVAARLALLEETEGTGNV